MVDRTFAEAGKQTPVFVRFSTVAGNLGSFDLARDVRGFATKFYTDEGNWDLVGNNIPVFFVQDAHAPYARRLHRIASRETRAPLLLCRMPFDRTYHFRHTDRLP